MNCRTRNNSSPHTHPVLSDQAVPLPGRRVFRYLNALHHGWGCSTSPAPGNRAAGLGGVRGARGLHTHLSRAPHTGRSHRLWAEGRDLHSRRRPSHRPPGCPLGASNSSLCDKDHDSFALSRICHLKTDTTIQKPEPTHSSKHGRQETDPEVPPQVSLKEMLSPCPVTGLIPSRYFWAM